VSNLTSLIGSVIATDPSFAQGRVLATASALPDARHAVKSTRNAAVAVATAPNKQILQLNALPVTITAARYTNALSSANPKGDLAAAYALRLLADPIPDFTHYYNPSPSSTDQVYGAVIQSAAVQSTSSFASLVLAGAQASYSRNAFAQLDGTPGTWHLVEASPFDWWDASLTDRFQPASVDFANSSSSDDSPFLSIGTQADDKFSWQVVDSGGKVTQVPLSSTLANVSFRFLRVTLTRSWLNFTLFQTNGWNLPGQSSGFISSGNNQTNDGIFPLLPTGFVLGTEVAIDADAWSSSDQQVIAQAQAGKVGLSVGPFAIAPPPLPATKPLVKLQGTTLSSAALQIIGWISALVPPSPTA